MFSESLRTGWKKTLPRNIPCFEWLYGIYSNTKSCDYFTQCCSNGPHFLWSNGSQNKPSPCIPDDVSVQPGLRNPCIWALLPLYGFGAISMPVIVTFYLLANSSFLFFTTLFKLMLDHFPQTDSSFLHLGSVSSIPHSIAIVILLHSSPCMVGKNRNKEWDNVLLSRSSQASCEGSLSFMKQLEDN